MDVSIPFRYAENIDKEIEDLEKELFQFLLGTLKTQSQLAMTKTASASFNSF